MRKPFFRSRRGSKQSQSPTVSRRLGVVPLEDRIAPAAFTVDSLLDTAIPPPGTTTLRSAIAAANADNNTDPAHPDVISFSVIGTIALTSDLPPITGSLSIQGPGVAGLTVLGPTAANSATQSGIIGVASSASATVSGLIVDGNAANPCVFVDVSGSVALQADIIQHGNGYAGGGITTVLGNVTVTDSTITANNDVVGGGGIYTGANLTITRSTFSNNTTMGDGGGVDIFHGLGTTTLTITASTFSDNFASGHGGAVNLSDGINGGNTLSATVADSTFAGNAAFWGGALSDDNRFSSNTINLSVAASTITQNVDANYGTGSFGGGLFVNGGAGPVRLFNIILAGNGEGSVNDQNQITSISSADDAAGALDPTGADNLIGATAGPTGLTNGTNGNQIGSTTAPINPLLGPLQDNGGPTQTVLPLPASPALDHGGPDPVLAGLGITTDQRGQPRIAPLSFVSRPSYSDGRDIGAVEGQITTLTVNTTSDSVDPPADALTLRQALQVADGALLASAVAPAQITTGDSGFYQIEFALPAASTITLTSALPAVTAGVAILGPGSANLTVLGDGQRDALLTISPGAVAAILGLILDGNLDTNSGIAEDGATLLVQDAVIQHALSGTNGGGILNLGGSLDVVRTQFLYDASNNGGGGVASIGGSLDVRQSTFSGDAGGSGPAIYDAASTDTGNGGTLLVLDSTFTNNVTSGQGGALDLEPGSRATVVDCTFTGNFAGGFGGAIGVFGQSSNPDLTSTLVLSGSTLFGNLTTQVTNGAGLYVQSTASAVVRNTIVAGNTTQRGAPSDVSGGLDLISANNLIGVCTDLTGISADVNANLIGTPGSPIDPKLGPLANNGGPTQTLALLPGSPAIDHGAADPVADGLTTTDQSGNPRVIVQPFAMPPVGGDGRDIGAYELPAQTTPTVLTVNSLADANPPTGVLTLRQALEAADGLIPLTDLPAGQVSLGSPFWFEVPITVSGTIDLASVLPAITNDVSIQGPGAGALTIEGSTTTGVGSVTITNGGSGYTSPQVTFSPPPTGGTTATGIAIVENGQVVGVSVTDPGSGYTAVPAVSLGGPGGGASAGAALSADITVAVGATAYLSGFTLDGNQGVNGGISVEAGADLLVQDSVVQNAANQVNGGGILSQGGNVSVVRTQFLGDVAGLDGGAIASIGGNLSVSQSTFSGGFAPDGGAIYNAATATAAGGGGSLSVFASTFWNDQAVSRGGALDLEPGSQATVTESTFSANFAGANIGGGGAIGVFTQSATQNMPSSLMLTTSTLFGNQVGSRSVGAGLYVQGAATAFVRDTIVAGNQQYNGPAADVFGALDPTCDHDLIGDGTGLAGISAGMNGNLIGTAAAPVDPKLGQLANNGGPTQTFALLADSPAVDTGSGEATTSTDQRGAARITFADIGAYQATAAALALSGLPASVTGDTPTMISVSAVDTFGEPALGYLGTVTFTSTDPEAALPSAYTFTTADSGAHEFSVTLSTPGNQLITVADAALGISTTAASVVAAAAPQVQSVVVNNGAVQRSEVRSIAVTFSGPVTFAGGNASAAAAFQLTHLTDSNDVALSAAVATDAQGQTVVTLTFTGSETDPVSAENGGMASLADGRYSLTILSAAVFGPGGQALNGGGPNGNYVSPADTVGGGPGELHLYRLFGDTDGDGIVDQVDLGQFRSTFNAGNGNPLYLSFLDADNSGFVDQVDLGQFRSRFNTNVF